jgi:hypothetical protein
MRRMEEVSQDLDLEQGNRGGKMEGDKQKIMNLSKRIGRSSLSQEL